MGYKEKHYHSFCFKTLSRQPPLIPPCLIYLVFSLLFLFFLKHHKWTLPIPSFYCTWLHIYLFVLLSNEMWIPIFNFRMKKIQRKKSYQSLKLIGQKYEVFGSTPNFINHFVFSHLNVKNFKIKLDSTSLER